MLRLLHYAPVVSDVAGGVFGAGAHTDYGMLTFLATDGQPGLQIESAPGRWEEVPHVPGAYVVNLGA